MDERDPNEGSIDPMVEEYWLLGENLQDRILAAGYSQETVDGIAVDIHDLLQAADLVKSELAPAILAAQTNEELRAAVERLRQEFHHCAWHGTSGRNYLDAVIETLAPNATT